VPHEVETFVRCEEVERDRDELEHLLVAARSRSPQERLQLRKREFDRIEIGTVGREKPEARSDPFNRRLDVRLLVHRQIVEDDHIARSQCGHERLFDVREEARIVDRSIEDDGRVETITA